MRSPLGRERRWRQNTIKNEETRFPPRDATPPSDTEPPPVHTFRVTDIPSFNPSITPPVRTDCISNHTAPQSQAPAERESSRPRLRPPETFPRSQRQMREDRRREARRARAEQTWTTTVYGLEEDEPTQIPQLGICRVSRIQCGICATHRILALRFCYRCFPKIVVNQTITTSTNGDTIDFKGRICFLKRSTIVEMRQHGFSCHLPQEHVNFRYPLSPSELEVIASRDEDRYNREVRPRTLPL